MPARKNTLVYVAAFLLLLGGVSYLAWSGFNENSVYFLNVAEAKSLPAQQLRAARLFGTVADGDVRPHAPGPGVTFSLQDKDNASLSIEVNYTGAVPDTFKPGAEVIVEGAMGGEGRFDARILMTKCPSKYQKQNRTS
jgi:cytochrome c-type biogenesis protein CcmE